MRNLAFCISLALAPSVLKASPIPWYWEGIVRSHCKSPDVRCPAYKDGNTLANFTYVGDGHRKVFMLNWYLWEKHGGDAYANVGRTASRKDILMLNKERLQLANSACYGSAVACGIAVTAIPLIIPKIVLSFTCATGATYCKLRTEEEIAKIDAEIKQLDAVAAGGTTTGATGGGNPPTPAQPMPSLPPKPNGVVTINDNPHKKNIP